MTEGSAAHRDFFISRAGENAAVALQIAEILRGAGYSTFIQDQDFGSTDFMAKVADGFAMVDRGARLIALAIQLNNLALLLQATNRLGEAEPLIRRALVIFEAGLGADHPSTRTVRENLAALEAEMRGAGS